ncbi:MAG: GNAT family N-acetyltransferase [Candidatus Moranbacteria bacterium]|nr:GNAT family N-acetyltransferase [Candidatus Moranbacteria bacterium]
MFVLDKNFWGKGIGLEVSRLVLKYAFEDLEIEKVLLSTSELHQGAIRMYEKIGFKKSKIVPKDRTIFHNRKWVLSGTLEMEMERKDFKY